MRSCRIFIVNCIYGRINDFKAELQMSVLILHHNQSDISLKDLCRSRYIHKHILQTRTDIQQIPCVTLSKTDSREKKTEQVISKISPAARAKTPRKRVSTSHLFILAPSSCNPQLLVLYCVSRQVHLYTVVCKKPLSKLVRGYFYQKYDRLSTY